MSSSLKMMGYSHGTEVFCQASHGIDGESMPLFTECEASTAANMSKEHMNNSCRRF